MYETFLLGCFFSWRLIWKYLTYKKICFFICFSFISKTCFSNVMKWCVDSRHISLSATLWKFSWKWNIAWRKTSALPSKIWKSTKIFALFTWESFSSRCFCYETEDECVGNYSMPTFKYSRGQTLLLEKALGNFLDSMASLALWNTNIF